MPYGSARARTFYGRGDFFKKLRKVAKGVTKVASSQLGRAALGFVPGGGLLSSGLSLAGSFDRKKMLPSHTPFGGVTQAGVGLGTFGTAIELAKAMPGNRTGTPTNLLGDLAKKMGMPFLPGGKGGSSASIEKMLPGKKRRKKRRTTSRPRRRSRSRYQRGDYGDNWTGNRPSRAKGTGRFLTRAGGRRRKRRGARRDHGGRVSFVTKSGKRVTFTPGKRRRRGRAPNTLVGGPFHGMDS
jgi:hypothetical protein